MYFLISGMTYKRWVNAILGNLFMMKNKRDPREGVVKEKADDLNQDHHEGGSFEKST